MNLRTAEPVNPILIKVHSGDNVAIVANDDGLSAGTEVPGGLILLENIPQGHKVSLVDIEEGTDIIRYGEVIGKAARKLLQGSWVQEDLIHLPKPPALNCLPLATKKVSHHPPIEAHTFEGYRNRDGRVGTKNILAIVTSVQCVAGVAEYAVRQIKDKLLNKYPHVDDVVAVNHAYGCGVAIDAPQAVIPIRSLKNIVKNPNFGGEVLVLGLGCEKLEASQLVPDGYSLPENMIRLQEVYPGGFKEMVNRILEMAEEKLVQLNQRRRETCPVSDLVVGVQCGGSDSFSGVTANPAVGYAADMIVRAGGTVMFSEVTEVRDAIHLLTARAGSVEVGKALIREMQWYDNYLASGNTDRSANPTPGNKEGGLSNVVEKALGSIIKSGSSAIVDVLSHGERVRKKGLVFAATPASDFICGTQQVASGISLQVFTTGRGTPYGLPVVPVIKVSSRKSLSDSWFDLIDLDAGRIATGESEIADIGEELFGMILDVASGKTKTAVDRLGLVNDLVIFNPAPIT